MGFEKKQLLDSDRFVLLRHGFDMILEEGYEHFDVIAAAEAINLSEDELPEEYNSKEAFYSDAFKQRIIWIFERLQEKKNRAGTERKTYDALRLILMETQTKPFISSIYAFYENADEHQLKRFWEIVEEFAKKLLLMYNKTTNVTYKKQLIYCLSLIYSKKALAMHELPYSIVSGCGSTECDILAQVMQGMRSQKKRC